MIPFYSQIIDLLPADDWYAINSYEEITAEPLLAFALVKSEGKTFVVGLDDEGSYVTTNTGFEYYSQVSNPSIIVKNNYMYPGRRPDEQEPQILKLMHVRGRKAAVCDDQNIAHELELISVALVGDGRGNSWFDGVGTDGELISSKTGTRLGTWRFKEFTPVTKTLQSKNL